MLLEFAHLIYLPTQVGDSLSRPFSISSPLLSPSGAVFKLSRMSRFIVEGGRPGRRLRCRSLRFRAGCPEF